MKQLHIPEWEFFQDEGYFGMWCVRGKDAHRFGEGFHTVSKEEAAALASLLNAPAAKDSELAGARAALAKAEEQLGNLDDCCERMQADAIRWVDRIRALEEALEPFKRLADSYFYRYETRPGEFRESHENDPDERAVYGINRVEITTGDFRRARTVLSREKEAG